MLLVACKQATDRGVADRLLKSGDGRRPPASGEWGCALHNLRDGRSTLRFSRTLASRTSPHRLTLLLGQTEVLVTRPAAAWREDQGRDAAGGRASPGRRIDGGVSLAEDEPMPVDVYVIDHGHTAAVLSRKSEPAVRSPRRSGHELTLNDGERDSFACHLDRVRVAKSMGCEASAHAGGHGKLAQGAARRVGDHGRPAVGPSMTHSRAPTGSVGRKSAAGRSAAIPGRSMPAARRLPPLPGRPRVYPVLRSRSLSASASASLIRRPARHTTTISARTRTPVRGLAGAAHDRDDLLPRRRIGRISAALVARGTATPVTGHAGRRMGRAGGVEQHRTRPSRTAGALPSVDRCAVAWNEEPRRLLTA